MTTAVDSTPRPPRSSITRRPDAWTGSPAKSDNDWIPFTPGHGPGGHPQGPLHPAPRRALPDGSRRHLGASPWSMSRTRPRRRAGSHGHRGRERRTEPGLNDRTGSAATWRHGPAPRTISGQARRRGTRQLTRAPRPPWRSRAWTMEACTTSPSDDSNPRYESDFQRRGERPPVEDIQVNAPGVPPSTRSCPQRNRWPRPRSSCGRATRSRWESSPLWRSLLRILESEPGRRVQPPGERLRKDGTLPHYRALPKCGPSLTTRRRTTISV